jgi:hypothetical protein
MRHHTRIPNLPSPNPRANICHAGTARQRDRRGTSRLPTNMSRGTRGKCTKVHTHPCQPLMRSYIHGIHKCSHMHMYIPPTTHKAISPCTPQRLMHITPHAHHPTTNTALQHTPPSCPALLSAWCTSHYMHTHTTLHPPSPNLHADPGHAGTARERDGMGTSRLPSRGTRGKCAKVAHARVLASHS